MESLQKVKCLEKTNNFIIKAKSLHGNKYDYSNTQYVNSKTKVIINCSIHGEFSVYPTDHISKKKLCGCKLCAYERLSKDRLNTIDEFKSKAIKRFGHKFDYSYVNYRGNNKKIKIKCPIHGIFEQTPINHLNSVTGCLNCGIQTRSDDRSYNSNIFIDKAKSVHNDKYDYSQSNYIDSLTPVKINCPIHGYFNQRPDAHLRGLECYECGQSRSHNNKIKNYEYNFYNTLENIHDGKYNYSDALYKNNITKIKIKCPIHGIFEQTPHSHLKGHGCPKCGNQTSKYHEYIKSILDNSSIFYDENNRSIISPYELDFYLPDYNIAIEVNGIYWHSEIRGKDKNYHLNKTKQCQDRDIQLIHINENEFINSKDIIKSKLNSILNINKRKLYGRKCEVREIDTKLKSKFLNKYHLQGNDKASIKLGLFYNGRLVSVMTFCKRRIALGKKAPNKGEYELSRFCGNFNFYVIGGASKLLKYFERNYNPSKIVTYADKRWSQGDVYFKLGFIHTHDSKPNYWYFERADKIYHRFNFRKSELNKKLDKFDPNKTEWENMKESGWNRIWDCGNMVFEKHIKFDYINNYNEQIRHII